ncbi:ThuA domain-containing protein [Paenibacillus sp.]|uniref:ThuA domain-containing protein n=1 Tax=Paenibacillus sp. TaxID=58172 RepID=UPI0028124090|nr:ThuA domain-containing protein [Paenibacillus sp.]
MTKKTVVALVGDYYHRASWAEAALRRAAAGLDDVRLQFVEETGFEAALEEGPGMVVLFKEDRVDPNADEPRRWMSEALQRKASAYVEAGGSWLAWHSGLASYDPEGPYVKMLRGYFEFHPALHQQVRYVPTAADEAAYELYDEHYFVACDEANTHVFLRSSSVDGDSIAGWSHAFGRGFVACYTPAHNEEALRGEAVASTLRKLLARGLGL